MLNLKPDLAARIRQTEAAFFDVGGTLCYRVPDAALRREALSQLAAVLQEPDPVALHRRLSERHRAYHAWAQATLIEASEVEFWTHWMLPDCPPDEIAPRAAELMRLWRGRLGRIVLREDADAVLTELGRRGYRLGIISNTLSANETPDNFRAWGLAHHFAVMVLSSTCGRRKPGAEIFWQAAHAIGIEPAHCAYLGDWIARDVIGPHRAGFAISLQIRSADSAPEDLSGFPVEERALVPDRVIHRLAQLLDLFPAREGKPS